MFGLVTKAAIGILISVALNNYVAQAKTLPEPNDLIWGINGHPLISYPGIRLEEQLDLIADLGLKYYRVGVTSIDQTRKLELLFDLAEQRGIQILPVLSPPGNLATDGVEHLYSTSYAFAEHFVSHFASRVNVWELANELEAYAILLPCEMQDNGIQYNCSWGPAAGVTKLEYHGERWRKVSSVLRGLSDATKAKQPTARRAIGTAGWGHVGAFERMRDDGIEWEISVWHNYDGKFDWGLEKVAAFGKPIWLTEFNFAEGSKSGRVQQSIGIAKAIANLRQIRKLYDVQAAFIYELIDETYWEPSFEAFMGLVHLEKTDSRWMASGPKPAYCSVRSLIRGGHRMGERNVVLNASKQDRPVRSCNLCNFDSRNVTLETALKYSYCLTLGRDADAGGLADWSRDIRSGKKSLLDVNELMVRHRIEVAQKDTQFNDAQFVAYLRRLLLDAEPDGLDYWIMVRDLERKMVGRDEVIRDCLTSHRFRWMHPTLFNVSEDELRQK